MADHLNYDEKNDLYYNHDRNNDQQDNRREQRTSEADFMEETSAEVAALGRHTPIITDDTVAPRTFNRPTNVQEEGTGGKVMGAIALALSVLSLFYSPVLFGAAGIIVGFIARRRGANGLGNWAIGIGVVSMVIGMFIAPFFY